MPEKRNEVVPEVPACLGIRKVAAGFSRILLKPEMRAYYGPTALAVVTS